MNRFILILGVLIALGAGLASPVVACTQEAADRLAETDTQARRDTDLLAEADSISFAVLTAIQFAAHRPSEDDVYRFSVEETLRGAEHPAFDTPNMIVWSCRHGDQSWHLERLRIGERVLVLGGTSANGIFIPKYIMPARDHRARRLLALFERTSAGE